MATPRLPWRDILTGALLGAGVVTAIVVGTALSSGRGIVDLLVAGADGPSAAVVRADFPGVHLPGGVGHDGQQYYAIARQPMHLSEVAPVLDRPRYRAQRPLQPWLAWAFHPQGGGPGLVAALVAVGAVGLVIGGLATGALAASLGAAARPVRWMTALFSVAPGAIASVTLTTPDALATALALAALALARRDRPRLALLPAVLAVLAKEALLLVLAGYALTHRRRRADVALAAVPALAAAAWWWWVRTALPGAGSGVVELRPLLGFAQTVRHWARGEDLLAAVLVASSIGLGVAALVRAGLRSPLGGVIALQVAFLFLLHPDVLALNWNASRTTLPLLVTASLALAAPGRPRLSRPRAALA